MRKPVLDNIEIVEPPIGELTKTNSSLKKTCLAGCGCVIFLLIGAVVGLRLFVGSGPTVIKTLPDSFPADIPIYEKDSIDRMTFISGTYKNRSIEIASIFPKIILSPLLLQLRHEATSTNLGLIGNKSFWNLLSAPVGDARDTVQIDWSNLDAEPSFVISYYRKELAKSGYQVDDTVKNPDSYEFNFNNEKGVSGSLFAQGKEEVRPGTDYASLTVNIPPK